MKKNLAPAISIIAILLVLVAFSTAHATSAPTRLPISVASDAQPGPELLISPASQSHQPANSIITLDVNVSNVSPADPIGGWTVYVWANISVLNPVSITLGSFLSNATASDTCINGLCTGTGPGPDDGPGIVHSEVYSNTTISGSGTLFTISYMAVGGDGTPVFPFSDNLFDPNGASIAHTTLPGDYGTVGSPDFTVASYPYPYVPGTYTIAVSGKNGFTGKVTLSLSASPDLGAALSPKTLTVSPPNFADASILFLTSTPFAPGYYIAEVTGTSGPLSHTTTVVAFVIAPIETSIASQVINDATSMPPSGSEVAGASFHDTATVTGVSQLTPTGTVLYKFYTNGDCTGTVVIQPVTLTASGTVPSSPSTGPLVAGNYSYKVSYSGDGNYAASASSCEPFTVGRPLFEAGSIHYDNRITLNPSPTSTNSLFELSLGVVNPNPVTGSALYVQVSASIVCGSQTRTGMSTIYAIKPIETQDLDRIQLSVRLQPTDALPSGRVCTLTLTIHWGTSSSSLPFTSNGVYSGPPGPVNDHDTDDMPSGNITIYAKPPR